MKPKLTNEEIRKKIEQSKAEEANRPPKLDKCKELAADVRERVNVLTHTRLYGSIVEKMALSEIDRRASLVIQGMEGLRRAQEEIDEIQKDGDLYDKHGTSLGRGYSKTALEIRRRRIDYYLEWNRALEDAIARKNFKPLEQLIAAEKYHCAANFEDVEVHTRRRPNRLPPKESF